MMSSPPVFVGWGWARQAAGNLLSGRLFKRMTGSRSSEVHFTDTLIKFFAGLGTGVSW